MVDIVHRIAVSAPPAKVFEALTTVTGVAGWWTRSTDGDAGQGGAFTTRFLTRAGDELGCFTLTVTEAVAAERVAWQVNDGPPEWIGTSIRFALSTSGAKTVIGFRHADWRECTEFTSHCSMKWATFLLSLRQFVETGAGSPSPDDLKIDDWN